MSVVAVVAAIGRAAAQAVALAGWWHPTAMTRACGISYANILAPEPEPEQKPWEGRQRRGS